MQAANGLTWPGAIAVSAAAIAPAVVLVTFIRN